MNRTRRSRLTDEFTQEPFSQTVWVDASKLCSRAVFSETDGDDVSVNGVPATMALPVYFDFNVMVFRRPLGHHLLLSMDERREAIAMRTVSASVRAAGCSATGTR